MENLESNENSLPNHTASLDIHLIVRRKRRTLYLDTLENIRVFELKKMIEGKACVFIVHLNKSYLDEYKELTNSTALLSSYGLNSQTAVVTHPAILGLAERQKNGSFESLEMTPYSDIEWLQLLQLDVKDPKYEKYAIW